MEENDESIVYTLENIDNQVVLLNTIQSIIEKLKKNLGIAIKSPLTIYQQ